MRKCILKGRATTEYDQKKKRYMNLVWELHEIWLKESLESASVGAEDQRFENEIKAFVCGVKWPQ